MNARLACYGGCKGCSNKLISDTISFLSHVCFQFYLAMQAFDWLALPPSITSVQPWDRFLRLLKPGGRLLISDYCRAPEAPSAEFGAYIAQRGYDLHPVAAYGAMLEAAGFEGVVAEDRTWQAGRFPVT